MPERPLASGPTVNTHAISTPVHGRYLVAPAGQSGPAPLLVGFHGYGEYAERHLKELNRIPQASSWIRVAIQGLHRFYSQSRKHVVASWMTRQDRELAIADNIAYVNNVVRSVKETYETSDTLVVCGFSQGVAMAYRFALNGDFPCDGIIALAGDIPPEFRNGRSITWPPVLIGRGTHDEWYTENKLKDDLSTFESGRADVTSIEFSAGHEWTDSFRNSAGRFLNARKV